MAVVGVWIFWSGVFVTGSGWIVTVNVLLGGAIATVASYIAAWPRDGPLPVPGVVAPAIALVLGLLTAAVPFVVAVSPQILFWSTVAAGGLVVVLSGAIVTTAAVRTPIAQPS